MTVHDQQIAGMLLAGNRVVTCNGDPLPPREDVVLTWASSYEWGRNSFGTRMLSVAILARMFDEAFARAHYERFAAEILAELEPEQFLLTGDRVVLWRRSIEPDDFDLEERAEEAGYS